MICEMCGDALPVRSADDEHGYVVTGDGLACRTCAEQYADERADADR